MTYIPSKEELEEMGFHKYPEYNRYSRTLPFQDQIHFYPNDTDVWVISIDGSLASFHPTSKQDIENLIRLFSKPTP